MKLWCGIQLVGRVRGRPPQRRAQRRARAATRVGDLAVYVVTSDTGSDALTTAEATDIFINGLAESALRPAAALRAAVQLANFSSFSSIATLTQPLSPAFPPPQSSTDRPRVQCCGFGYGAEWRF